MALMNGQEPEDWGQGLEGLRCVEERREGWIRKNATCLMVSIFNREPNLEQDTKLGTTPNTGQSWLLDQGGPGTIVTQSEGWSISPVTLKYHVLLDSSANVRHQS